MQQQRQEGSPEVLPSLADLQPTLVFLHKLPACTCEGGMSEHTAAL